MKLGRVGLALLLCASAAAQAVDDKSVLIKSEDAEMLAAIKKARDGLDDFLTLQAKPPAGASGFKLKVMFTEGSNVEHMWVIPFRKTDTGFIGVLADEPEEVKNVRLGQRVTFSRADVSDWGYVLNGKQKGSFTVCVVFKHLPPDEVKQYREEYGFEC
jgi:uncharacterized protein YegJ (DUF2314 family)